MEFLRTVKHSAKLMDDGSNYWDILMETNITVTSDEEVSHTERFECRTFDISLQRGIEILNKASFRYFADLEQEVDKEK